MCTVTHEPVCSNCTSYSLTVLQDKAAERAAFKEVRAISNSTSKRAAADARQVYLMPKVYAPSISSYVSKHFS